MSTPRLGFLSVLALVTVATVITAGERSVESSFDLKYETSFDWEWLLPAEKFVPVEGAIPVAHENGAGFKVELKGTTLAIDTNGDAKPDVTVRGRKSIVQLRAIGTDGKPVQYAARLAYVRGRWMFATSGSLVAKIDGVTVRLFDQNGNGRYGDVGEDALIVGDATAAAFHSDIVSIGGKLRRISLSKDGRSLKATPFEGKTGKLDLDGGFVSAGRLLSAVVKSVDGRHSFQLAGAGAADVPAGEYRLVFGRVTKGREHATIKTGKSQALPVVAGKTNQPQWGGPLHAKFYPRRQGDKLALSPRELYLYGRAGEQYVDFIPEGRSPEFQIVDVNTTKDLVTAKFGVST